jgi:hypothetical protein
LKKYIAIAAVVASLAACSTTEDAAPAAPIEKSAPVEKKAPAAPVEPKEEELSEKDIAKLSIRIAFNQQSSKNRELMCIGIALTPGAAVDAFIEGAGGQLGLTRAEILKEFKDICAGIDV